MEEPIIKPYVIGLDLGGTNSVFGIVDSRGDIKATTAIKTQAYDEVGITVESSLRHRLFDDISHLKEATLTFAEAGIHYLVGSTNRHHHTIEGYR